MPRTRTAVAVSTEPVTEQVNQNTQELPLTKDEGLRITRAFVGVAIKAFKGDEVARHCVMSYDTWFKQAARIVAIMSLIGGDLDDLGDMVG